MSFCKCKPMEEGAYKSLSRNFLRNTSDLNEWNLVTIKELYEYGNSLESIYEAIPFRSEVCNRTKRCCGVCTRQCYNRCMQDCLHRLFMWRKLVENTPESEREGIPLGIRMIVKQKFDDARTLSWSVGEILSQNTNTLVKEFMKNENLRPGENPYKIDYSPQMVIDSNTGRRIVNNFNGNIKFYDWPETGLCPYCLPEVTVDRRCKNA